MAVLAVGLLVAAVHDIDVHAIGYAFKHVHVGKSPGLHLLVPRHCILPIAARMPDAVQGEGV